SCVSRRHPTTSSRGAAWARERTRAQAVRVRTGEIAKYSLLIVARGIGAVKLACLFGGRGDQQGVAWKTACKCEVRDEKRYGDNHARRYATGDICDTWRDSMDQGDEEADGEQT